MTNLIKFAEIISVAEEGFSASEYFCTQGYATTGFGRKVSDVKYFPLSNKKVTKGEEIKFVRDKINEITNQLRSRFPLAWGKCNDQRQAILVSLAYQIGFTGISAFKNMWACLDRGDFEGASKEMVNSRWYQQTKNRALRHAQQMRTGTMHVYYLTQGTIQ